MTVTLPPLGAAGDPVIEGHAGDEVTEAVAVDIADGGDEAAGQALDAGAGEAGRGAGQVVIGAEVGLFPVVGADDQIGVALAGGLAGGQLEDAVGGLADDRQGEGRGALLLPAGCAGHPQLNEGPDRRGPQEALSPCPYGSWRTRGL
ncbi:hypothetical protein [Streptomyces nigrescens]